MQSRVRLARIWRMGSHFEELMQEIEAEAEAEGPQAVAQLHALDMKYFMINQLLQGRRELHLTQKQLAERSGIGQAEISKIERGQTSPTMDTYSRLCSALGIHPTLPEARAS